MVRPTLVVHGHFYQPPRENPWTESVPVEPSAAPFHDWNERITAESYRPNGWARIVDEHGRLLAVVDNYAHLSFDVGPTLMSWLEGHAPDVADRMREADAEGGGAVAAPYHHVILPLAPERDVRTQVRWGLADFAHRFGRPAEGLWLPETAVNDAVLAVLVEEGVRFTVLAPGQALRVRPLSGGPWTEVGDGTIDTHRTYRWQHPDGGGLDVVFYDGPLSHEVAFGVGGLSSAALVDRARRAAGDGGLVCLAADGETFGHHHPYTERALAYGLPVEAPRAGMDVTTVAGFLAAHPPEWEAQVWESAWSCAHGVGRWREDCGCSTGGRPGADQRWRAALRAALDLLRGAVDEAFERRGGKVLDDPWAARDAYGEVVVGARSREDFVAEHVTGDPVEALTLLEAQRHALSMYTSCAWFFWDLAGLETVQSLREAACAMDLLRQVGEEPPEEAFLELLGTARSNQPEEGDGRDVWVRHVLPARVDAPRTAAHVALRHLLEGRDLAGPVGAYDVVEADGLRDDRGPVGLSSGVVTLEHRRTGQRHGFTWAALTLGRLEVVGSLRPTDPGRDDGDRAALLRAWEEGAPVTALLRLVSERFGPAELGLADALPDAAGDILAGVAASLAERAACSFEGLVADHADTITSLLRAGVPLPSELRGPVEVVQTRRFLAALDRLGGDRSPAARAELLALAADGAQDRVPLASPKAAAALERVLGQAVGRAVAGDEEAAELVVTLLRLNDELGVHARVERAQDAVYAELVAGRSTPALRPLGEALWMAVDTLGVPAP